MESFANAIHIKTEHRGAVSAAVEDVLARAGFDPVVSLDLPDTSGDPTHSPVRRILVSPATNGWVSVFDENFVEIFDLATRLSAFTHVPAMHLWGNGHKAWGYQLADDGRLIDQYSTDPNYIDGESRGVPDVLSEYAPVAAEQFRRLFEEGKGLGRVAMSVFANLFGIRNAESDFERLASGQTDEVVAFEEFVELTFLKR